MDKFTLEVEITMAAEKALNEEVNDENILAVTRLLGDYILTLDDENEKRKYTAQAMDLAIYGIQSNKRYNQKYCKNILKELSELVIPTATFQF